MFSSNAHLAGLSESGEHLEVSKVLHKAFIEISEEGTEAAAATGKHHLSSQAIFQSFKPSK